jgi:DNA-binding NtrC family response regulator
MKKVLVVDDTKNIRTLLTTCLEVEGYEVMTADTGIKALSLIQTYPFDLVFLDIKLPELSGTEVLRSIRGNGIQTPVIIMTAFATVKNAVECTKLGAITYLQKPFTAEKVRAVLREVIETSQGVSSKLEHLWASAKEMLALGRPAEALGQLKLALAENPNCGETYLLLGEVYHAQGNTKEAERFKKIAGQFYENNE